VVGRCGLACEHDSPRHNFLALFGRQLLDSQIAIDDIEDVHELPFVLVDAFDLDIKEGVLIDGDLAVVVHPLRQLPLVV